MADYLDIGAAFAIDALLQSTIILGAGLLVARCVRLPARAHAVLAIAFACAILTPLASSMVRVGGWGVLAPNSSAVNGPPIAARDDIPANEMARQTSPGADFAVTAGFRDERRIAHDSERLNSDIPAYVTARENPSTNDAESNSSAEAASRSNSSSHQEASSPARSVSLRTVALGIYVAIWLTGSLWTVARLLRSMVGGSHLLATAAPCTSDVVERTLQITRDQLGLGTLQIDVLQSSAVRCPVIWCWGRHPRLVLPDDAVAHWSTATWTPVLCRELAHWLRCDHLIALAAELGCCLLPWQPLAWWAKWRMEHACEQACDDWAVATGHSAVDYAETLLGLVAQNGSPLELAALRRRSGLAIRIRHVLTERIPRPHLGRRWAVAVISISILSACGAAFCQRGVARAEPAVITASAPADKPAADSSSTSAEPADKKPSENSTVTEAARAGTAPALGAAKPASAATTGAAANGSSMKGVTGGFQAGGTVGGFLAADKRADASTEPRLYTATGRVIDPDGKPVAVATVTSEIRLRKLVRNLWNTAPVGLGETTTDAVGQFSLTARLVEQDVHHVQFLIRAAGYGVRGHGATLEQLDNPLEFQLDPSYPIEGTVLTPNGDPVQGARVILTQIQRATSDENVEDETRKSWYLSLDESEMKSGAPRAAWPAPILTDENGTFRFEDAVPIPASANLTIKAEDFALTKVMVKHERTILHPRDQYRDSYREPTFTLVLENPWRVEGRFTDEKTGEALGGVELKVTQNTFGHGMNSLDAIRVTTDQEGRYKLLAGSADYYSVHVTAPLGYPGIQNTLNASTLEKLAGKGRKVKYDIKLRRGTVLHGRVVAEDTGEPVPDVEVSYRLEKGRRIGTNSEFPSVRTAADGTFEMTGTSGKGFLLVDAPDLGFYRQVITETRAQNYQDATYPHGFVEINVPEDGQEEPVTIPLKRGRELVVRALSPSGQPVAKVASAYAEREMAGYFGSGEAKDNFFRIKAAQPGRRYRVYLFSEDAMAGIITELEVPEDGHTIDVRLEPTATIRGRYVFSGGGPAAEVSNFPHFHLDPQQEETADFQIFNLPFYNNFVRLKRSDKPGTSTTDADGNFVLEGIVPGTFMYMSLNYKFEDGKTYRSVGTLAPGEVKDLGDVLIQSR